MAALPTWYSSLFAAVERRAGQARLAGTGTWRRAHTAGLPRARSQAAGPQHDRGARLGALLQQYATVRLLVNSGGLHRPEPYLHAQLLKGPRADSRCARPWPEGEGGAGERACVTCDARAHTRAHVRAQAREAAPEPARRLAAVLKIGRGRLRCHPSVVVVVVATLCPAPPPRALPNNCGPARRTCLSRQDARPSSIDHGQEKSSGTASSSVPATCVNASTRLRQCPHAAPPFHLCRHVTWRLAAPFNMPCPSGTPDIPFPASCSRCVWGNPFPAPPPPRPAPAPRLTPQHVRIHLTPGQGLDEARDRQEASEWSKPGPGAHAA